jgi:hypothetical protein
LNPAALSVTLGVWFGVAASVGELRGAEFEERGLHRSAGRNGAAVDDPKVAGRIELDALRSAERCAVEAQMRHERGRAGRELGGQVLNDIRSVRDPQCFGRRSGRGCRWDDGRMAAAAAASGSCDDEQNSAA